MGNPSRTLFCICGQSQWPIKLNRPPIATLRNLSDPTCRLQAFEVVRFKIWRDRHEISPFICTCCARRFVGFRQDTSSGYWILELRSTCPTSIVRAGTNFEPYYTLQNASTEPFADVVDCDGGHARGEYFFRER